MKKLPYDMPMALKTLTRISEALERPVSSFLSDGTDDEREAETIALLKAFNSITDRHVRARCLTYMKIEAELAGKL